jgi:hypothetical protein
VSPEKQEPQPEEHPTVEIVKVGERNRKAIDYSVPGRIAMLIIGVDDPESLAEDLRGSANPDN